MVNVAYQTTRKFRYGELNNAFINSLDWSSLENILRSHDATSFMAANDVYYNPVLDEMEWCNPLTLTMKANAEDNPRWNEAMNRPNAEGFWRAMEDDLTQLGAKFVWEEVSRDKANKILPSTWTYKVKCFADGSVRKLKARFCARGDCQIEGVNFFDTYAPMDYGANFTGTVNCSWITH